MPVDDVFDDGEAQAGALPFAALLALDAIETFRKARQVLARQARAVVAYGHGGEALARLAVRGDQRQPGRAVAAIAAGPGGGGFVQGDVGPDHDLDRAAGRRIFDGVVDEILDHLQDLVPVAVHGRADLAVFQLDDDVAFGG